MQLVQPEHLGCLEPTAALFDLLQHTGKGFEIVGRRTQRLGVGSL